MAIGTVVADDGRYRVVLEDGQAIFVAANELPISARQNGARVAVSFGSGDADGNGARELLNYLLDIRQ